MVGQRKRNTSNIGIFLLSSAMLATLSGCTVSYDPDARAELMKRTCDALLTKKLDCIQQSLADSEPQRHSEVEQQMLPIHQREEVLMSALEDLRRNH